MPSRNPASFKTGYSATGVLLRMDSIFVRGEKCMGTVGCINRLKLMSYVVLLAVVSNSALAQEVWKEIATDGDETAYAAPGTISEYADIKAMWELRDYKATEKKSPNGKVYRSTLRHASYKCKEEKLLVTEDLFFEGHGGDGQLVGRVGIAIGQTDNWLAVRPKTVEQAMMKRACSEASRSYVWRFYKKVDQYHEKIDQYYEKVDKFLRHHLPTTDFTATL